jgi:predicted GNAT family acetyltransferase
MKQELTRALVDGTNVPIVRDAGHNRVEITIGDQTAFLTYRLKDNVLSLIHTEVPPALRGKGMGDALARAVLNDAKDHGLTVKPNCPFVAAFIRRHPEYVGLVDPGFTQSGDAQPD